MRQGNTILTLMLVLGVLAPVNAVERALIDFTTYNDNIGQVVEKDQEIYEQIIATNPTLDIRNFGWPEFAFEASDWNLENWKVVLNPSSDTKENRKLSQIKNSPSKEHGNVLGIRVKFNPWDNSFWAHIKTPFYFAPTYMNGQFVTQDENNNDNGLAVGLLINVGQIKNVRSWVYGLNYQYTYGVQVVNEMGKKIEFGLGSIYHEGWRRVSWDNNEYIAKASNISNLKNPLYPFSYPYIKFEGLSFYKPAGNTDPNFISYVKDITIDYDLAVVREDSDINDEAIWQIVAQDTIERRITMSKLIAEELLLQRKFTKLQNASQQETAQQNNANNANNADAAAN